MNVHQTNFLTVLFNWIGKFEKWEYWDQECEVGVEIDYLLTLKWKMWNKNKVPFMCLLCLELKMNCFNL